MVTFHLNPPTVKEVLFLLVKVKKQQSIVMQVGVVNASFILH